MSADENFRTALDLASAIASQIREWNLHDEQTFTHVAILGGEQRVTAYSQCYIQRTKRVREKIIRGMITRYQLVADLVAAAEAAKSDIPLGSDNSVCHVGLCPIQECSRCSRAELFHRSLHNIQHE